MAVRGNEIVYVGDKTGLAVCTGRQTKGYERAGRLVLPGLIDVHTHPGWVALTSRHLQLPGTKSIGELLSVVKNMVRENPGREVLRAPSWK